MPWRSPDGKSLHIAAAVPEYTWASLALALLPNGRASDGRPGSPPSGDLTKPIGVPIESYVTGLYADGYTPPAINNGYYQPPTSTDDTANLPLWSTLVQGGVNTVSASLPGFSDIVNNSLGGLIGFAIYRFVGDPIMRGAGGVIDALERKMGAAMLALAWLVYSAVICALPINQQLLPGIGASGS